MKLLATCPGCTAQYDLTGWQTGDVVRCRCGMVVAVPEPRATDARLVRCASCGAVRNSDKASNCEFCGALFSAVDKGWGSMCPACFCRLPTDAQFCVECGLKIDPQKLESADTQLHCPRCTTNLRQRSMEKALLQECGACAGLWMSAATFEDICRSRETQSLATQGLGLQRHGTKFELSPQEQVKYIPCPVCKNLMNRRNFGNISGVVIDTCKCGVWLDNQELNRIVQFIQNGGLERSRQRAQQEQTAAKRAKTGATASAALDLPMGTPHPRDASVGSRILIEVLGEVAKLFFYK